MECETNDMQNVHKMRAKWSGSGDDDDHSGGGVFFLLFCKIDFVCESAMIKSDVTGVWNKRSSRVPLEFLRVNYCRLFSSIIFFFFFIEFSIINKKTRISRTEYILNGKRKTKNFSSYFCQTVPNEIVQQLNPLILIIAIFCTEFSNFRVHHTRILLMRRI